MKPLIREFSVIDPPHNVLAPDIWTEDGALKSDAKKYILDTLFDGLEKDLELKMPEQWIGNIVIIGSSAGYRWTWDSDIDVTVPIDTAKFKKIEKLPKGEKDVVKYLNNYFFGNLNGSLLPGTKHEVNYYAEKATSVIKADAIYDIASDTWLKKEAPVTTDQALLPEEMFPRAWRIAESWASKIDLEVGNIRRNLWDVKVILDNLSHLDPETLAYLKEAIERKVEAIESDLEALLADYDSIRLQRWRAFWKKEP